MARLVELESFEMATAPRAHGSAPVQRAAVIEQEKVVSFQE
jgi:hypothetical protein